MSTNREQKREKPATHHLSSRASLKPEAFERGMSEAETAEFNEQLDKFLKKIYDEKPTYAYEFDAKKSAGPGNTPDNKDVASSANQLYKKQIEILCKLLVSLSKEYKQTEENIQNANNFPEYLLKLFSVKATSPAAKIKTTLEKIIFKLQEKKVVDEDKIRAKFKRLREDKVIDNEDFYVKAAIAREKKDAEETEHRKQMVLEMLLPQLGVCDFGILGNLDFSYQFLLNAHTARAILSALRTQLVDNFSARHKRLNPSINRNGSEIHVDTVMRNEALMRKLFIDSELESVTDDYARLTMTDKFTFNQLETSVLDDYQLRSWSDAIFSKFQMLCAMLLPEEQQDKIAQGWFAFDAKVINLMREIMSSMELPGIPAETLLERKEDYSMRFLPLYFKQVFWQYCQRKDKYVEKDIWQEEKVFENYRLVHPKVDALTDAAWIEGYTSLEAGFPPAIVSFDQLPEKEKLHYYIHSTVHYGYPDRFNWTKPAIRLLDAFKEKKDFAKLVLALAAQNQWERYESLLLEIMHEQPDRLAEMLNAIKDEPMRLKIINLINLPFYWLHGNDELHKPLLNLTKNNEWLQQQHQLYQSMLAGFQKEHKLDPTVMPVLYSELLRIAETTEIADQAGQTIFKMYLHRYYPDAYPKIAAQENPDYARAFLLADQEDVAALTQADKDARLYMQEGNLEALLHNRIIPVKFTIWMHRCNHSDMLKKLFRQSYSDYINNPKNRDPLLFDIIRFNQQANNNPIVQTIVENCEFDVNVRDVQQFTPLHHAIDLGLKSWVKELLKLNANVNSLCQGATPLSLAAQWGFIDIMQLLLNHGAKMNVTNETRTPIGIAAQFGQVEACKFLLNHGASANSLDSLGNTPLIAASFRGNIDIIELLLKNSAEVNATANNGATALHSAAQNGQLSAIKKLINAGANPCLQTKDKLTPRQTATDARIKQFLLAQEIKAAQKKVQKEKLSETYFLISSKEPGYEGTWIEDDKGEHVFFDDLSPAEKNQYCRHSLIRYGAMDHFRLTNPPPALFDVLKEQKDFIALAEAFEKENQWQNRKAILTTILEEQPHRFAAMLNAVKEDATRVKMLEVAEAVFSWLHPHDERHQAMMKLPEQVADTNEKLGLWLATEQLNGHRAKFSKFQQEHKLDENEKPIPYSKLVEIAANAKPEDEFVFKMYLQRYFPSAYEEVLGEKSPNFAKAFLKADEYFFRKADALKHILLDVMNGNITTIEMELKDYDFTKNIAIKDAYIQSMGIFQQQHLLNYFFNKWLIQYQQNNPSDLEHSLYWRVKFNQLEKENKDVEALLAVKDLDVNKVDLIDNSTMLHCAVKMGHKHWVKRLLEFKAIKVNSSVGFANETPLHLANDTAIAQLLVNRGADVDAKTTGNGTTPLMAAAREANLSMIRFLLGHGAQVNLQRPTGETALHYAAQNGHLYSIKVLLDAGADPTVVSLVFGGAPSQAARDPKANLFLLVAETKWKKEIAFEEKSSGGTIEVFAKDKTLLWTKNDFFFERHHVFVSKKCSWIEDNQGNFVFFEDLPDAEKFPYHITSLRLYGVTDYLKLTSPPPALLDVLKEEKDFIILAKAFEKENQWDKYKIILTTILEEQPHHFTTMLNAVADEAARVKMIEVADAAFFLLHQKGAAQERPNPGTKTLKAKFLKFQQEHKLESKEIPIPYSKLIAIAPKAKPEDEFVFKMYLQRYFPSAYEEALADKSPNFARAFLKGDKDFLMKQPSDASIPVLAAIMDGDISKVEAALTINRVTTEDVDQIAAYTRLMGVFQHQHLLDHFYKKLLPRTHLPHNAHLYGGREELSVESLVRMVKFNQLENEHLNIRTVLLNKNLDINNATTAQGRTLLHWAGDIGHKYWIKRLLEFKSIDVNVRDHLKQIPLHLTNDIGVAQLLINKEANVNAIDYNGRTPLSNAVLRKDLAMTRLLLEHGARVNHKIDLIDSVLWTAANIGYFRLIKLLVDAGADPTLDRTPPSRIAADPKTKLFLLAVETKWKKEIGREEKSGDCLQVFAKDNSFLWTKDNFSEHHCLIISGKNAWIEDKKGNFVFFEDLPQAEKMHYYIHVITYYEELDKWPQIFTPMPEHLPVSKLFSKKEDAIALLNASVTIINRYGDLGKDYLWYQLIEWHNLVSPVNFEAIVAKIKDEQIRQKILNDTRAVKNADAGDAKSSPPKSVDFARQKVIHEIEGALEGLMAIQANAIKAGSVFFSPDTSKHIQALQILLGFLKKSIPDNEFEKHRPKLEDGLKNAASPWRDYYKKAEAFLPASVSASVSVSASASTKKLEKKRR